MPDDNYFKPLKAYNNTEFLNSRDGRLIRILAEYLEPASRFRHFRVEDTIVFFGSARVKPRDVAEEDLRYARALEEEGNHSSELENQVAVAERNLLMSRYYEDAVELARLLTEWSKGLTRSVKGEKQRHFIICSGGGPGIMEAANRGAAMARGKSIGLGIGIPQEQFANHYISRELSFEFHYFFMRKFWFVYLAKALVIFPGGFGTLDELFELLTLLQTHKLHKPVPVVMYGTDYWKEVLDFDAMVRWGTISAADLDLIHFSDTPHEAFDFLHTELERTYNFLPTAQSEKSPV
jgi:uncharacterized protein (TIGR00730 family)